MSVVIPIIDVLRSTLEDLEDNGVGTVKQEILNSLDERFGDIEDSPLLLVATLLDPRYKDKMFSSSEVCQKAKDEVLKIHRANQSLNTEIDCEEPKPAQTQHEKRKPTIWDKMAERMKKHGHPGISYESYDESHGDDEAGSSRSNSIRSMEVNLSMYCAEEVIPLRGDGSDPFQYW